MKKSIFFKTKQGILDKIGHKMRKSFTYDMDTSKTFFSKNDFGGKKWTKNQFWNFGILVCSLNVLWPGAPYAEFWCIWHA